jgi:acetyltransferase-like isoleucine patch superfamily enzyme
MIDLFNTPSTHWFRWLFTKWKHQLKYAGKNLKIEYMAEIKDCNFSSYNTVYKHSRLRNATLGEFSYVARNCQIYNTKVVTGMGAHPSNQFVSSHPLFYSTLGQAGGLSIVDKNLFDEFPSTEIGNDVWIGNNAIIKYGIKIGDGAIIGSGAVVTKDVAPYSIVGGVPAKLIKYRFTEEQMVQLNKLQWWNKDLEWLKKHKDEFSNIDTFVKLNR